MDCHIFSYVNKSEYGKMYLLSVEGGQCRITLDRSYFFGNHIKFNYVYNTGRFEVILYETSLFNFILKFVKEKVS